MEQSAATASSGIARRATDHYEPCAGLQVLENRTKQNEDDITILYRKVDRLPNWMVMLWGATTACLGASVTAIFFLVNQISQILQSTP